MMVGAPCFHFRELTSHKDHFLFGPYAEVRILQIHCKWRQTDQWVLGDGSAFELMRNLC